MVTQSSPGVVVNEVNISTVVPGVDASTGAIAGLFRWGPVNQRVLVDTEPTLVRVFGRPTNYNPETFFTAANFLAYTTSLEVVRAANTSGASPIISAANVQSGNSIIVVSNTTLLSNGMILVNASNTSAIKVGSTINVVNSTAISLSSSAEATGTDGAVDLQFISNNAVYSAIVNTASVANLSLQIVNNSDDFAIKDEAGDFDTDLLYVARWPGAIGNSLRISVCDSADQFAANIDLTHSGAFTGAINSVVNSNTVNIVIAANTTTNAFDVNTFNTFTANIATDLVVGDYVTLGNTIVGYQTTAVTSITNTAPITLGSNNGSTVDIETGNTTIITTSNAFDSLANGQIIAVYQNSSTYTTVKIDTVTDGNNAVLAVAPSITNATATWSTISNTSFRIDLTTQNLFKRTQNTASTVLARAWEFAHAFDRAPGQSGYVLANGNTSANDEVHIVVVDDDGKFTAAPGTILEKYVSLSRATDAVTNSGDTNYYKTVVNQKSGFVWLVNDRAGAASANALNVVSSTNEIPFTSKFVFGQDGADESTVDISAITNAYDQFASTDDSDISLVMQGKARGGIVGEQIGNYLIDNIAEERKDCVAFISPDKDSVVNAVGLETDNCIAFRNALRDSSYAFMDSGYKYMYDKYNNVYRWVPLNGDIAGLAARTDSTNDPWWSFAGLNRGKIKNIVKLAWNPKKSYRDQLYKNSINPVITMNGEGTVLYGDKTLLSNPSAFDRINVRRLFLVLEKSISKAAKFSLFEFNDPFTRAQFRNLIIPFLTGVQGKRGITDFIVRCDGTNNGPEIVGTNQFVGDIFIRPNYSINFISLNFIAVNPSVTFAEAENVQF